VYLRLEGASRTPCFHLYFVVARLCRESDKAIALNSVTTPRVNRVHLQKQVWSVSHFVSLSQKLKVKREGKMANILGALHIVFIIHQLNCRSTAMSD
jgi:hypothetical protein